MKEMFKTKFIVAYQHVNDTKRFDGEPDECFYYSYRDEDKNSAGTRLAGAAKKLPHSNGTLCPPHTQGWHLPHNSR